jgi:hypothetical protein
MVVKRSPVDVCVCLAVWCVSMHKKDWATNVYANSKRLVSLVGTNRSRCLLPMAGVQGHKGGG